LPASNYNDKIVNELRKRLWYTAYKFAREVREDNEGKNSISGLELLMALHQMIEETHHHWIEDNKKWNDILSDEKGLPEG
jgi:hypothetical protein